MSYCSGALILTNDYSFINSTCLIRTAGRKFKVKVTEELNRSFFINTPSSGTDDALEDSEDDDGYSSSENYVDDEDDRNVEDEVVPDTFEGGTFSLEMVQDVRVPLSKIFSDNIDNGDHRVLECSKTKEPRQKDCDGIPMVEAVPKFKGDSEPEAVVPITNKEDSVEVIKKNDLGLSSNIWPYANKENKEVGLVIEIGLEANKGNYEVGIQTGGGLEDNVRNTTAWPESSEKDERRNVGSSEEKRDRESARCQKNERIGFFGDSVSFETTSQDALIDQLGFMEFEDEDEYKGAKPEP